MCGIAGAIWTDPVFELTSEVLEQMTSMLAHRGPDGEGYHTVEYRAPRKEPVMPGVALGHRRLAIIDPLLGAQPLSNEDGTIWTVFNGEIYNYRQLRQRLEGAGHRFRTNCDTETLVHLYEDEGLAFLQHLNGMFALAIWDARNRRLVLARDRLGKKPLYYRREPRRLLFASELKSLMVVPGAEREVDPQAVDEYLTYNYVPHSRTILRGYSKLPPAHYGIFADGRWITHCYWNPNFNEQVDRPRQEYAGELRELVTSSVKMRLQADVPLGAFLSGGIDSSLVVGLMQRLSDRPVRTFSIGFSEPRYDETPKARRVAERLGTDHQEFIVEPRSIDVLEKLVWYYDEPFADSSAIPTYYVSQLSRQHVTVALTGDGGDELFGGYERYQAVRLASLFDQLPVGVKFWRWLGSRLGAGRPSGSRLRRLGRFASALDCPPLERYLEWVSLFNLEARGNLYTRSFLQRLPNADPAGFLRTAFGRWPNRDPASAASLTDLVTYLPCDLLYKVDMASMANSLECRMPLLDYRVVELAARMPSRLKLRRGRGKHILREAFPELIPPEVFRQRKQGFAVPLAEWFRGELRDFAHEILLDSRATRRDYFLTDAVRRLLDDHAAGRADHGSRLWGLLFFELWHRQWIDQPPQPQPRSSAALATS